MQMHRAHEELRRTLPPFLVGALAGLLPGDLGAPQGLAAIKAGVLQEASAAVAAVTLTTTLGAWIVSEKIFLAAAGLVALAAFGLWRANPAPIEPLAEGDDEAEVENPPAQPVEPEEVVVPAPVEVAATAQDAREELVSAPALAEAEHALSGSVTDAHCSSIRIHPRARGTCRIRTIGRRAFAPKSGRAMTCSLRFGFPRNRPRRESTAF